MRKMVVLMMLVAGCAGQPKPIPEAVAPQADASPTYRDYDNEMAKGDPIYIREVSAEERARDRSWYRYYSLLSSDGYAHDEAVASADRLFGKPTWKWPDGYFERHP